MLELKQSLIEMNRKILLEFADLIFVQQIPLVLPF